MSKETFSDKLGRLLDGDETAAESVEVIGGVKIPMISMPKFSEEVLQEHLEKPGFLRQVLLNTPRDGGESFTRVTYVSPNGGYIGDAETAARLMKWGIVPELASDQHKVCSIGWCEKEQKWFGWSHRAICGFGIGDIVKEGDCTASSGWIAEYLAEHPEADKSLPVGFTAKTLDDAKSMAIAFAESVG